MVRDHVSAGSTVVRLAALLVLTSAAVPAATPPSLVNYQGVLRDNNDKPLTGTYDMTFRFMDAATGGNEILLDIHAASAGASPITVSGGLFDVALGSGALEDGSGPGTYTTLDAVFNDYGAVWLEVQVGAETLAPRTRIESAAYALNATNAASAANAGTLDGYDSSFFLDTSSGYQIKNGPLRIQSSDPSIAAVSLACNGTSIGFRSNGCSDYGGLFEAGSSSGTGVVGDNGYYGVRGIGTVGGLFYDPNFYNYAYVGDAPDGGGIVASGQTRGGFFQTATGNYGDFGYSDRGFYEYGVWSHGKTDGGYFENLSGMWGFVADHLGATIRGNGSKNFEQNHPELPDRTITYSSLEGDEVGTYTRGSGRLVGGQARIVLGPTFQYVTNPELGLTVYVTPAGAPARLYVAEKSTREIVVKAAPGDPDVVFDYIVTGLRLGFEDANVVREKDRPSPVPSLAGLREQQARHPELGATTARARFEAMDRGTGRALGTPSPSAAELLAKIREADREVGESPQAAGARIAGLDAGFRAEGARETPSPQRAPDPRAAPVVHATSWAPPEGTTSPTVPPGAALLELPVAGPVDAGDLLVPDPLEPGTLHRADLPNDPTVVAIAAGPSTLVDGALKVTVVTTLYAQLKVDATYGAIRAGDLLVSSGTPGCAMVGKNPPAGTVIGKALDPLAGGTGLIRVLLGSR